MVKMTAVYDGDLHCRVIHWPSGNEIATDAPADNMGKAETFSPTDLLAASLGSCILTVMGIVAMRHQIFLQGTSISMEKEMVTEPVRRVGKITVIVSMTKGIPSDKREMLETAARTCPVHKSLHPDVEAPIEFLYPD